jgi:hypothetical protein
MATNTLPQLKVGSYVVDTSASGRHYTAVYRIVRIMGDQAEVRYVGEVVNGRLTNFAYDRQISYRQIKVLREYLS